MAKFDQTLATANCAHRQIEGACTDGFRPETLQALVRGTAADRHRRATHELVTSLDGGVSGLLKADTNRRAQSRMNVTSGRQRGHGPRSRAIHSGPDLRCA